MTFIEIVAQFSTHPAYIDLDQAVLDDQQFHELLSKCRIWNTRFIVGGEALSSEQRDQLKQVTQANLDKTTITSFIEENADKIPTKLMTLFCADIARQRSSYSRDFDTALLVVCRLQNEALYRCLIDLGAKSAYLSLLHKYHIAEETLKKDRSGRGFAFVMERAEYVELNGGPPNPEGERTSDKYKIPFTYIDIFSLLNCAIKMGNSHAMQILFAMGNNITSIRDRPEINTFYITHYLYFLSDTESVADPSFLETLFTLRELVHQVFSHPCFSNIPTSWDEQSNIQVNLTNLLQDLSRRRQRYSLHLMFSVRTPPLLKHIEPKLKDISSRPDISTAPVELYHELSQELEDVTSSAYLRALIDEKKACYDHTKLVLSFITMKAFENAFVIPLLFNSERLDTRSLHLKAGTLVSLAVFYHSCNRADLAWMMLERTIRECRPSLELRETIKHIQLMIISEFEASNQIQQVTADRVRSILRNPEIQPISDEDSHTIQEALKPEPWLSEGMVSHILEKFREQNMALSSVFASTLIAGLKNLTYDLLSKQTAIEIFLSSEDRKAQPLFQLLTETKEEALKPHRLALAI